MEQADISAVGRLCNAIHLAHPEDEAVIRDRLDLYPAGCFVLADDRGAIDGYVLSHPVIFAEPPPLNSLMHRLPEWPTSYYIHDLALTPEARGQGHTETIINRLLEQARHEGLPNLSLIAIAGAHVFWARQGFSVHSSAALLKKLESYGADARFMQRPLS